MTRFLHLTDLHLEAGVNTASLGAFDHVLATAVKLDPKIDFILISGDLTDKGDEQSYLQLAERVRDLPIPVHCALGNHDARTAFRAAFPDAPRQGEEPLDYDLITGGVHLIVLDSLVPGQTSGELGPDQVTFLKTALARHLDYPKLLMIHHPPKFTRDPGSDWASLKGKDSQVLSDALAGTNTLGILAGHIHTDRVVQWNGLPVVTTVGLYSAQDPTHPVATSGGISL